MSRYHGPRPLSISSDTHYEPLGYIHAFQVSVTILLESFTPKFAKIVLLVSVRSEDVSASCQKGLCQSTDKNISQSAVIF